MYNSYRIIYKENTIFKPNPKRKFEVNDKFFDVPNLTNCYYAGFIAADGCIKEPNIVSISISKNDEVVIKNFLKDLNSNYKIHYEYPKNTLCKSSISICSYNMCEQLSSNFNITPRKSLTLQPPNINNTELIDSFIKGYIDGDGCINIHSRGGLRIRTFGTIYINNWIKKRYEEILGKEIADPKKTLKNCYCLSVSDSIARKLFHHYYEIPNGLKRKWKNSIYDYCVDWKRNNGNIKLLRDIFSKKDS